MSLLSNPIIKTLSDPYILSIIIFIIIVAVIVVRDRKKFERQAIILLRRTQKGKNSITRLGRKFPRFWKCLGTLGAVLGFAGSVYIIIQFLEILVRNLFNITQGKVAAQSLAFVLPTPTATAISTTGLFLVPFWYWIIAIALLVVVHEGMHGILSAAEKIKLKSLGWGLLLIIPLAFVEPDEKALQKRGFWTQARIFAGGSFANFILAGIAVLIMGFAFTGMYTNVGVIYQGLTPEYPAADANMTGYITQINGQDINSVEDLSKVLDVVSPGDVVNIKTVNTTYRVLPLVVPAKSLIKPQVHIIPNQGEQLEYNLIAIGNPEDPGKGYIGVSKLADVEEYKPEFAAFGGGIEFIGGLLFFLFVINFGVGLANLLPIKPLDGGRMWEVLFQKISKKHSRRLTLGISYFTFLLLVVNFILPFA